MEKYGDGEVRAFEVLYDRHSRPLFNFILKFVSHRENAEEILQETFMRVIKGHKKFQQRSKFTTWVYTIARNLCVDKLRKLKHRRHKSLDQPVKNGGSDDRRLIEKVAGEGRSGEDGAMDSEIRKRLEEVVEELPVDQKEVFLLREVSNLPFKEIAGVIGCPENTVKSRMRYALERLREGLSDFFEVAGGGRGGRA